MILTWILLSYFKYDINSYYNSDKIEKWYNLSKYWRLELDNILKKLKSEILSDEKRIKLEKESLTIIKKNNLSKVLYTPILSNLVDKNIKWYKLENDIPESFYRFEPIYKSYVNQDKAIIMENKNFLWYLKYLINTLF
jgi:hypothetical protein